MIWVRKSKMNQFLERIHKIPVLEMANKELCAVFWERRHLEQCPAPASAKAFHMPRRGRSIPLSYSYYTAVLKSACKAAGMHPGNFSSHSLKRGGAMFLRMCGSMEDEVKERLDWKSDSVKLYLKSSVLEKLMLDMRVTALLGTFQL